MFLFPDQSDFSIPKRLSRRIYLGNTVRNIDRHKNTTTVNKEKTKASKTDKKKVAKPRTGIRKTSSPSSSTTRTTTITITKTTTTIFDGTRNPQEVLQYMYSDYIFIFAK